MLAQELIDRASDNPDFGTAMKDLINARRIMDEVGIPSGFNIRASWEIVYSAVVGRETPKNLPDPSSCLYV